MKTQEFPIKKQNKDYNNSGGFSMSSHETLLKDALKLRPVEKAHLIEDLMASLENPDSDIESLWEQEALRRYEAFKQKRIKVKDLGDVLRKYE